MTSITPFLWFEDTLEEAMNHYKAIFPDGHIISVQRQGPDGPVFTATFELAGQRFMGLNGGRHHEFNDSISLFVSCKDQAEVDRYWAALTADGGKEVQCGWLKDKFGVSWQIIPEALFDYLNGSDRAGAERAMQAMLGMIKIDIAALKAAYEGKA